MSERVYLSYEEAAAMLPPGDKVHTFAHPGVGMVIGADWDREEVLSLLKVGKPELSGEMSAGLGHGLVAHRPDGRALFIETVEATEPGEPS